MRSWTALAFPRGLLLEHKRALCCTVGAKGGPVGPGLDTGAAPRLPTPPPADAVLALQATLGVFWPVPAPFTVSLAVYRRTLLVGTLVWSLPDQQLSPLCGKIFEVWAVLVSLCPVLIPEPWVFVPCLLCTFFG